MAPTRRPIVSKYQKGYEQQIIGWQDTSPPPLEEIHLRLDIANEQELPFLLEELLNDERLKPIDLRPPRPPCPGLIGLCPTPTKKRVRIIIDLTINNEIVDLTNE